MKPHYDVLGKSHFALAVICDLLARLHPDGCSIQIVANIPEEQNTSRGHDFTVAGVTWSVIDADHYQPDPVVPKVLGSIGKARRAIFTYFFNHHDIGADQYYSLVHPMATVGAQVALGHGVHVGPGASIAPYAKIRDFSVINRNVSVGHHTVLDDFACLNPGVTLAGVCHLERDVTVGAGATIIDQIHIGARSVIGAGSVVTKNIPADVVAYGVPARVVRENS
ncbi:MAG: hypothetical protein R3301_10410 [Saprospiraceae bacterium]|nr:hypothetical protein [Saprospiraceae bacterium]